MFVSAVGGILAIVTSFDVVMIDSQIFVIAGVVRVIAGTSHCCKGKLGGIGVPHVSNRKLNVEGLCASLRRRRLMRLSKAGVVVVVVK